MTCSAWFPLLGPHDHYCVLDRRHNFICAEDDEDWHYCACGKKFSVMTGTVED